MGSGMPPPPPDGLEMEAETPGAAGGAPPPPPPLGPPPGYRASVPSLGELPAALQGGSDDEGDEGEHAQGGAELQ
jgi:hypothetical protein